MHPHHKAPRIFWPAAGIGPSTEDVVADDTATALGTAVTRALESTEPEPVAADKRFLGQTIVAVDCTVFAATVVAAASTTSHNHSSQLHTQ